MSKPSKGICEHGEFDLSKGCPQCITGRRNAEAWGKLPKGTQEACEEIAEYEAATLDEPVAETALVLRPGEDVEVRGYYADGVKLFDSARSLVIATTEDLKPANDSLSFISKLKKAMESKRKTYLDPLKASMDAIRDTYDYLMIPVLEADKIIRAKMTAYDAEQRRIRAEQEGINRKRQEAAEAELRLKGKVTEPVNLVEVASEPTKSVSTDIGSSGLTDHWKYEIIDFALLPDEYKVVDSSMLNAVAKKHHDQKQVPGVRFYNEPFITVRPR